MGWVSITQKRKEGWKVLHMVIGNISLEKFDISEML